MTKHYSRNRRCLLIIIIAPVVTQYGLNHSSVIQRCVTRALRFQIFQTNDWSIPNWSTFSLVHESILETSNKGVSNVRDMGHYLIPQHGCSNDALKSEWIPGFFGIETFTKNNSHMTSINHQPYHLLGKNSSSCYKWIRNWSAVYLT